MDDALITNWNNKVGQDDIVFHLGDFSLSDADKYRKRLNGSIRFIRGNHDKPAQHLYKITRNTDKQAFLSFEDVRMVVIDGQMIWLSHYAHRVWPRSHHGAWHLYGHSHGNLSDDPESLSIDCGVDCHNFTPLSVNDIAKIMKTKNYKPKDHHGKD